VRGRRRPALVAAAVFLLASHAPLSASQADQSIEQSVKKSYVFKTYLKSDKIKIQSEEGAVTLEGTVSQESHRTLAEHTVMGLPGVKSVNNQLTVTGTPAGAGSDAELRERVQGNLGFHRSTSAARTDVLVTNGTVTLRGNASSETQKQLAEDYANDVSGVTGVDNKMTVTTTGPTSSQTSGDTLDDASITAQVRMSELYYHGSKPFDTKVSTSKGVVTLSGVATNQSEIDGATKRVADIHGVTRVNNLMTVETTQSSTN